MSNITHLLTNLRSTIFNTLPSNPKNLRTGTKYLRRRLRGPSIISYYPHGPSLSVLNSSHPSNKYAGWKGLASSDTSGGAARQLSWQECVEPGWKEVPRLEGAGWLEDADERRRRAEVVVRRADGRGAPKKGQGKRSQMKKK